MRLVLVLLATTVLCFGPSCPLPMDDLLGDGTGTVDRSLNLSGTYSGTAQTKIVEMLDTATVIDTTSDVLFVRAFDATGIQMSIDGTTAIYEGFTEVGQNATTRLEITYTSVAPGTGTLDVMGDITLTLTEGGVQRVLTGTSWVNYTLNAAGDLVMMERIDLTATTANGHVFRTQDSDGTLTPQ